MKDKTQSLRKTKSMKAIIAKKLVVRLLMPGVIILLLITASINLIVKKEPLINTVRAEDFSCNMCPVNVPYVNLLDHTWKEYPLETYACINENKMNFFDNLSKCIFQYGKIEGCALWDINNDVKVDAGDLSFLNLCCNCHNPTPTPTPITRLWISLNQTRNSPPNAGGYVILENIKEDKIKKITTFNLTANVFSLEPYITYRIWILRDGTAYNAASSPVFSTNSSGDARIITGTIIFNGELREIARSGVWKSKTSRSEKYRCHNIERDIACLEGRR